MARKLTAVLTTAIIWGAVALAAVYLNAKVDVDGYWNAKAGYAMIAAVVIAAFVTTELALTRLKADTPYEP